MTKLPDTLRQRAIDGLARAIYAEMEGIDPAANKAHMDYWFSHPDENDEMIGDDYRKIATTALNTLLSIIVEPDEAMIEAAMPTAVRVTSPSAIKMMKAARAQIFKAMILKLSETGS